MKKDVRAVARLGAPTPVLPIVMEAVLVVANTHVGLGVVMDVVGHVRWDVIR